MALPGVRTIIKDRFYSLAIQDNSADAVRVVAIARRLNTESEGVRDYDPYSPNSEEQVIAAYGEGSELHRAYVELAAVATPRISLVAVPANVTDTELASATVLDKAFEAAESVQPGIIVPWGRGGHPGDWSAGATPDTHDLPDFGFQADMGGASLVKGVVDRCKAISDRTRPCFAVMGVTPFTGNLDAANAATPGDFVSYESMTASEISAHLGLNGLSDLPDREAGAVGEHGSYLSVIATEIAPTRYPTSWGYTNGAAMYAGYLSALPAEVAPTGKQLFNVAKIRYNPTRTLQEGLVNRGVVPLALNFSNQATVVDGLTFGKKTSDYTRLTTLRIVFDTIQLIRRQVQAFVGQPYTLQTENAMDTAISSALRSMMINGALQDAQFAITPSRRENKVKIDLVLLPAFEIRDIEISVSVQL